MLHVLGHDHESTQTNEDYMDFIHARKYLDRGDIVVVQCDYQANVLLTDDSNFHFYKSGQNFRHFGGHFTHYPARIKVPSTGYWNVTIDLGGGAANIKYSIDVLKGT